MKTILVLCLVLLTGCVTEVHWVRNTQDPGDQMRDNAYCTQNTVSPMGKIFCMEKRGWQMIKAGRPVPTRLAKYNKGTP